MQDRRDAEDRKEERQKGSSTQGIHDILLGFFTTDLKLLIDKYFFINKNGPTFSFLHGLRWKPRFFLDPYFCYKRSKVALIMNK